MYSSTWKRQKTLLSLSTLKVGASNFFLFSSFAGLYERPSPFPSREQDAPGLPRSDFAGVRLWVHWAGELVRVALAYLDVFVAQTRRDFRRVTASLPDKTTKEASLYPFFFSGQSKKLNGPFLKAGEQFDFLQSELAGTKFQVICEIGAGFGAAAEIVVWNWKPERYIIIDLPEMLEISHLYLASIAGSQDIKPGRERKFSSLRIEETTLDFVDATFLPDQLGRMGNKIDLFFNSNSFAEMDLPVLESYLDLIDSYPGSYLMSSNRLRREGFHEFNPSSFTHQKPGWELVADKYQSVHRSFRNNHMSIYHVR